MAVSNSTSILPHKKFKSPMRNSVLNQQQNSLQTPKSKIRISVHRKKKDKIIGPYLDAKIKSNIGMNKHIQRSSSHLRQNLLLNSEKIANIAPRNNKIQSISPSMKAHYIEPSSQMGIYNNQSIGNSFELSIVDQMIHNTQQNIQINDML